MTPTSSASTPLRVGVVGLGWAGQQHIAAYAANPDVDLVAIAGLEDGPRAELAEQFGIPVAVADWQELFSSTPLDAVSVAVPTFLHAPIAIAALQRGIHVLSEKPIARSAAEAAEMVAAARTSGRVLQVAFNHRQRGDVRALAAEAASGALGRIYHVRASWLRRSGIPALGSWFTSRELAGGGPLVDIGVHMIDAVLDLMGEPRVLSASAVTHAEFGPRGLGGPDAATGGKQFTGSAFDVEDFATVLLRLEGGASVALDTSWASYRPEGDEFGFVVYGTEGGAELRVVDYAPATDVPLYAGTTDAVADRVLPGGEPAGHQGVVDEFIRTIRTPALWAASDGSQAARRAAIIDACYRSAAEGREVAVEDVEAEVAR
ncbi:MULTISPECIES: Gfo/Idh/MocA family protein [Microbacterium]|uniref:Gfo/Idh/MocA family oxidoreductase n=1 Tax=Microbacterium wangchenii TaxID=2541726 RepID=A0ABX5SW05_9MICO|nr:MULTISPECIES: Gfo/Idh/MocA family oxidoreductase [Microbacterium]MCK6067640.1 Gfo/Idh/MocA family oxidoreductase [Microbacterium sp. EYE_512]QBR89440.1 Gfo/Idh/MocA family oxidoreductase [Microbacterium wangchenii]TFV81495.1 Gfo/Idh/MocA family oxidoreductase [Microbacterium sp. dk485]TXK11113.1 Gfo/Idh/MocA family oxidoreductase [Microbacterium wangchenii]